MKSARILDLHPTQFVLGMREIEYKISKMTTFNKNEMADYFDRHRVPVVVGPQKALYMIDHHHFARACWEEHIRECSIQVVKDLSGKNEKDFWNYMISADGYLMPVKKDQPSPDLKYFTQSRE